MKDQEFKEIIATIRNLKKQLQELEDKIVDKMIKDIELNKSNPDVIPYNPINPLLPDKGKEFDWTITSTSELES